MFRSHVWEGDDEAGMATGAGFKVTNLTMPTDQGTLFFNYEQALVSFIDSIKFRYSEGSVSYCHPIGLEVKLYNLVQRKQMVEWTAHRMQEVCNRVEGYLQAMYCDVEDIRPTVGSLPTDATWFHPLSTEPQRRSGRRLALVAYMNGAFAMGLPMGIQQGLMLR